MGPMNLPKVDLMYNLVIFFILCNHFNVMYMYYVYIYIYDYKHQLHVYFHILV